MRGSEAYGPKLTGEEYDRRIVELHRGMPPAPTPEQDRRVRRLALEAAIDHRLGCDFPRARREALWAAAERVESKRVWLGAKYLFGALGALLRRRHATALTDALAREYAKVLSPGELRAFLGIAEGERPALPIDAER